MDLINSLNASEALLIICAESEKDKYAEPSKKFTSSQISTLDNLKDIAKNLFPNAIAFVSSHLLTPPILSALLALLKPEGKLILTNTIDSSTIEFNLKTNGFINIIISELTITASKPKYEVGSSTELNLKKPAVWKLDDNDEEDLIDPDDLLDEDDLKKPDPTSLRVCGTTGQRKACKDCSCGLADELAAEAQNGKVVDTTDAPKSSCGSCYLGDAFRCASCPYLGMPAFKPGEKIQLSTAQLKSDI